MAAPGTSPRLRQIAVHKFAATTPRGRCEHEAEHVHPLLRAAAERQFGVFTATDARRAGYDPDEIRGLLSTGAWVRLRRGVYTTLDHAEDAAQRHLLDCVAVLAGTAPRLRSGRKRGVTGE